MVHALLVEEEEPTTPQARPNLRAPPYGYARGLTQVELAERLGITQSFVSKYERGDLRLHGALIVKLAAALRVSTDELLGVDHMQPAVRPTIKDRRLWRRISAIDKLSKRDRQALLRTLDAFLSKAQ
jgi:transcriptional regulator with XRE-family HTH domain